MTKSYSILLSRGAIFLRGKKSLLSRYSSFSPNCMKVTVFYWQLCNHDITIESVTLTHTKKKTFWCSNRSLSHSESDSYLPRKNLFVRESVLPGWWELFWSLWSAQTPRSPSWHCYDLEHLPAHSLWTAVHVNEPSVFLFVPMPCALYVERQKKST